MILLSASRKKPVLIPTLFFPPRSKTVIRKLIQKLIAQRFRAEL
jgi:hypothetical protein